MPVAKHKSNIRISIMRKKNWRGTKKGDTFFRHFLTECDRVRVAIHIYLYGDYATQSTWLRCA